MSYRTPNRGEHQHRWILGLPRMWWEGWERYLDLSPEKKRMVKGIVRGRIRGDKFKDIAEAVGSNVYYVSHYTHVLGIPSTRAFRMRKVAKFYCRGFSAPETAERMGLTVRAVNVLRLRLDVVPFARHKRPPRHRSPLQAQVAELHAEGLKRKEIAERLKVSTQTVGNWLATLKSSAV